MYRGVQRHSKDISLAGDCMYVLRKAVVEVDGRGTNFPDTKLNKAHYFRLAVWFCRTVVLSWAICLTLTLIMRVL